jgi:hypothetical protein
MTFEQFFQKHGEEGMFILREQNYEAMRIKNIEFLIRQLSDCVISAEKMKLIKQKNFFQIECAELDFKEA